MKPLRTIVACLLGLVLLLTPNKAYCPDISIIETRVDLQSIRLLRCGNFVGTGEIIAEQLVLTAAHVVEGMQYCFDGQTMSLGHVTRMDKSADIAILEFPSGSLPNEIMRISCERFRPGDFYVAYGFAHGRYFMENLAGAVGMHVTLRNPSNGYDLFNLARIRGVIIPGMSGGPIVDHMGVMRGMNNMTGFPIYPLEGFSRELRDTFLCKGGLGAGFPAPN